MIESEYYLILVKFGGVLYEEEIGCLAPIKIERPAFADQSRRPKPQCIYIIATSNKKSSQTADIHRAYHGIVVTLGALAFGYFFGGYIKKVNNLGAKLPSEGRADFY